MTVTVTAATAPTTGASIVPPTAARLLLHQLRYELRSDLRTPVLLGFTIAMPITMLAIFGMLLSGPERFGPLLITYQQFFVPNVVVLGLLSTCFASLGMALAIRRGSGELKRMRGTPLPPWIALSSLGLQTAILGVVTTVVIVVCGRWWFGVELPAVLPLAALLVVATSSLSAMGIAVATFIRRPENGPAITNGMLWPVTFISGTFTYVPEGSVLRRIAEVLPVRHLNDAAFAASPTAGGQVDWSALAVIALWGVIGALVAVRRFRWEPSASA